MGRQRWEKETRKEAEGGSLSCETTKEAEGGGRGGRREYKEGGEVARCLWWFADGESGDGRAVVALVG